MSGSGRSSPTRCCRPATWDDPPRDDRAYRDRPAPRCHRRRRRRGRPRRRPARRRRAAAATGPAHRARRRTPTTRSTSCCARLLANPVIERWAPATIEPRFSHRRHPTPTPVAEVGRRCATSTTTGSAALERERGRWRSTPPSWSAIRDHFRAERPRPDRRRAGDARPDVERALRPQDVPGPRSPTDDGTSDRAPAAPAARRHRRDRRAVRALGVRRQRRHRVVRRRARRSPLKAETHNHPSAVEPFGGANTGVGGVIRDVLGAAHRPIAVTDVLCFGPADLAAPTSCPTASLHPRRIRERRRRRRRRLRQQDRPADGRRRRALRPGYTANPLVFCGCIGVAADRRRHRRPVSPATGSSCSAGAPGATASAAPRSPAPTMDATTGEVAGASVQIGDPIIEKLLIDVLADAGGPVHGDHRLRCRRPVVGDRRDGRGRRRRRRARPACRSSTRASRRGRSGCQRGPGAHGGRRRRPTASPQLQAAAATATASSSPTSARSPATAGSSCATAARSCSTSTPRSCTTAGRSGAMDADAARARPRRRPRRRRRRPGRDAARACSPIRTSPPRRRSIRRYDHEIRGATVVRPLVGAGDRRPRRRRRARRSRRHPRHRHRHRRQPVVRRCTTPRRWRTPSSTRRSATSSPSAPTPTASPCSTTSRGATRADAATLGELVAAVARLLRRGGRPRRAVRVAARTR